jgi:gluconolactonase
MDIHSTITIYDKLLQESFQHIIIETISTGFKFAEGPVWHPSGFLLFSDTPANCIWQLFPDGRKSIFLNNSGLTGNDTTDLSDMIGSNGLAFDRSGNLLVCQHGNHAIARLDAAHQLSILVDRFENRPLNSPNDLVIHSSGRIFFTDPPYGLKHQIPHPEKYQDGGGLYQFFNGELTMLGNESRYPNGLCFSPDERYLYTGSNHPDEPFLFRYQLSPEGEIIRQELFLEQNADGMTTDKNGNLFLCTDEGILMISRDARRRALISLPELPSNITKGGNDGSILYVTARTSVYQVKGLLT